MPRLDLRIGARFAGAPATAVHAALQEAADLIAKMPATYITYPNGGSVLPTWWQRAYLELPLLQRRFGDEARASLPGLMALVSAPPPGEVFAALHVQRLRLRHDQQVPEWLPLSS